MPIHDTGAPVIVLASCPSSPNCVSSLATDGHFIEPLRFPDEPAAAWSRLRNVLERRPDTGIIDGDESKLRVEFRTALGFVDDGLFVMDMVAGVIHCRSAARVGYWDLGKNRRRIEEIRREFSTPE